MAVNAKPSDGIVVCVGLKIEALFIRYQSLTLVVRFESTHLCYGISHRSLWKERPCQTANWLPR